MSVILKVGSQQYRVDKNTTIDVEKVPHKEGEIIEIGNVLAVISEDKTTFGKPHVEGVKVKAKVLKHSKSKKIIVFKYKPKKRYRKKQGHRQNYTTLKIEEIVVG